MALRGVLLPGIFRRKIKTILPYVLTVVLVLSLINSVRFFNFNVQQHLPTDRELRENTHVYHRNVVSVNEQTVKHRSRGVNNSVANESEPLVNLPLLRSPGIRIDWHNYSLISNEKARTGPGEHGKPVNNPEGKNKGPYTSGYSDLVCDLISLDRSINDIRDPLCRSKLYHENLPNTSIVIPFHNEHVTALMRTVHSVFRQTPSSLLVEVILVDDASTMASLKEPLELHFSTWPKVIILRSPARIGLMRARLLGAEQAVGEVLTFLDCHCEMSTNWLPPLLDLIAVNRLAVAQPMIDVINANDFSYYTQPNDIQRGAFDWNLLYKRIPISEQENQRRGDSAEPFRTPIMSGGLFSISRDFFFTLGGYDDGLVIWGGEQYELSFKAWQCGGVMYEVPCSRNFMPYSVPGGGSSLDRNLKRVVEVWMDEYKVFFYGKKPRVLNLDCGDLSRQRALRSRLQCRSFDWFMKNVAYDLMDYYPPVPPLPVGWGNLYNSAGATRLCLYKDHAGLQMKNCLDVSNHNVGSSVGFYPCHGGKGNQYFVHETDTQYIKHPVSGLCMTLTPHTLSVTMQRCDGNSVGKEWHWEHYDPSRWKIALPHHMET